jgi:hypothetical protein
VYFPAGSIIGNTFVSEAAAYTVGCAPLEAELCPLLDAEFCLPPGVELDEDFLLLPHPAAATTIMAVATAIQPDRKLGDRILAAY